MFDQRNTLISALSTAIMAQEDAEPELIEMLTKEKIRALKEAGWDPDQKIHINRKD